MHRFFIDRKDISNGQFSSTDKELCHQVSKVLKMKAGKKVMLYDNLQHELLAEWTIVSRSVCEANILEERFVDDISTSNPVNLYVAPLKNQNRWELILEKGTEIGVASFTPLITERTEAESLRKPERLQRIIKEAAEQSGRTMLPELNNPMSFEQLLEVCGNSIEGSNAIGFIPTLHEDSVSLKQALKEEQDKRTMTKLGYNILIGPEGGFTEEEVEQALAKGIRPVTLGSQVLRTETAALVAAILTLQAL